MNSERQMQKLDQQEDQLGQMKHDVHRSLKELEFQKKKVQKEIERARYNGEQEKEARIQWEE